MFNDSNDISDFITYLQESEKNMVLEFDKGINLTLSLDKENNTMFCNFVRSPTNTSSINLEATASLEELAVFCSDASIVEYDDGSIWGISVNNVTTVLNNVIANIKGEVTCNTVKNISDYIRLKQKPLVWVFGKVTMTLDAIHSGLSIETDSNVDYCKTAAFNDADNLLDLMAFMTQCTITSRNKDGTFMTEQKEIFEKLMATIQLSKT